MANLGELLDYIVRNRQFRLDRTVTELETRADQRPAVVSDPASVREGELSQARRYDAAFARGLRAAWAAQSAGTGALLLDDRTAGENETAEALIRYLVRPDLATVETSDVAPGHYRYRVQVDWPAVEAVATRAGVDLRRELAG